jgi:hypothetical protein
MSATVSTKVPLPMDRVAEICRKWRITRVEVFGSVLRDDWDPDSSDIDLLVTFAPDADVSFFTLVDMEDDFAAALGRKTDVVPRRAIERSDNPYRRREILGSARVIYDAA